MGRLSALLLALVLGGASAMALASCGGSDAELLPGSTASEIESNLDQVQQLVDSGDCVGAEDAVAEVTAEVEGLSGVAQKLKAALEEGTARLSEVVSRCEEEAGEETEPSPERDVEAEELEEDQVEAEEKAEKAAEKAEKQAEKEEAKAEAPAVEEGNLPPQANGKGKEEAPPSTPAPEPPAEEEGASGGVAPSVGVE
jgi:hypothetical protein